MKGGEDLQGWIKLHRKILDNDIWHDPTAYRLFTLLLLKAAHKDGIKINGIELKRGQYLRSYSKLAEDLGYRKGTGIKKVHRSTVLRTIKKLVEFGMVSTSETSSGTLFTILNYEKYQGEDVNQETGSATGSATVAQQKRNSSATVAQPKQECKNAKNAKNSSPPPDNSSHVGKISQLFHQSFITNPFMDEKLLSYFDDGMEPALIEKAIMITKENNKDVSYLWGILNRLLEREIKTIEQYEQAEREREERKRRENYEQGWERHRNDTGTDTTYQEEGYYSQLGIGRRI